MRALQKEPINMWVQRVASNERYSDSMRDLKYNTTLGDLADAHRMIDFYDAVAEIRADERRKNNG